jgi:hypothetical protein
MKFYTMELLAKFSSDDEQIALAAQDELERRAEKYSEYLNSIAKKLPPRFRELQERYYLHDAHVIWPLFPWFWPFHPEMYEGIHHSHLAQPPSFMIAVQLDAPPNELVVLHYRGVRFDPPYSVWRHPPEVLLEWQHDEVELVVNDGKVEFLQSILFNKGSELRIRFTDFDFATLKPMTAATSRPNAQAG